MGIKPATDTPEFEDSTNPTDVAPGSFLSFVEDSYAQAVFGSGKIENPAFLAAIADFNFLYFSGVLFLISIAVIIGFSRGAAPPAPEQIRGLTLATIDREAVRQSWDRRDVIATAVVLGLVAAVYIYFSFWV